MAATIEQKVWVLTNMRAGPLVEAHAANSRFWQKLYRALTDPDIGPTITAEDRPQLLAAYAEKYEAIMAASGEGAVIPKLPAPGELGAFEPTAEELEAYEKAMSGEIE